MLDITTVVWIASFDEKKKKNGLNESSVIKDNCIQSKRFEKNKTKKFKENLQG